MIQVQRFNKALKSAVIIGDLVILDVLFVLQYPKIRKQSQWQSQLQ